MSRKKITTGVIGLAVAVTILVGCGSAGSSGSSTGQGASNKLVVGILPVADAGGFFTAEDQGFFKKQGLQVTQKPITGGATLLPALESGAMSVGFSNLVSVLQAGERNLDMKCLTGTLQKPATGHDLSLVVSPKYATSVKSAKDLEGKEIAVNTISNINQLVAEAWLSSQGADPKSAHFIALDFPNMPGALAQGRVTAAIIDEPFTTISLDNGAKLLAPRPYQAIAKTPVFSCWVASAEWINSHKKQAKAFAAALKDASDYIHSHPGYLRKILPKYTKISPALAKKIDLSNITTELSPADLDAWLKAGRKFGLLHGSINTSNLIANLGS